MIRTLAPVSRVALVASLLASSSALAAKATVSIFEAKVHERADAASPVLATLPEDAEVTVSEEVENGWRRIRLADGKTGFILDSAVRLSTSATSAGASGAGSGTVGASSTAGSDAPTVAREKASIFVKDLHHLAELTKSDPVVFPKAQALANRQTATWVTMGVGLAGVAVSALAGAAIISQPCGDSLSDACFSQRRNGLVVILAGGGISLAASTLVGLLVTPKSNDILDVLNEWNQRHPDEAFTADLVNQRR